MSLHSILSVSSIALSLGNILKEVLPAMYASFFLLHSHRYFTLTREIVSAKHCLTILTKEEFAIVSSLCLAALDLLDSVVGGMIQEDIAPSVVAMPCFERSVLG